MSSAHLPRLNDWTVLSLRPRGQHAGLRAAATHAGARTLALSVLAIRRRDDAATRAELAEALGTHILVCTSANAVRAANALTPLRMRRGQAWLAVGDGTRLALSRFGITAETPARMDSEGLLAMPTLLDVRGRSVGLITGSGGRGVLEEALRLRNPEALRRVDVYARETVPLGSARVQALGTVLERPQRVLLALSSGEALQALLAQVDDPRLLEVAVVAASERLAKLAASAGFTQVATASSARPTALMTAAASAYGGQR